MTKRLQPLLSPMIPPRWKILSPRIERVEVISEKFGSLILRSPELVLQISRRCHLPYLNLENYQDLEISEVDVCLILVHLPSPLPNSWQFRVRLARSTWIAPSPALFQRHSQRTLATCKISLLKKRSQVPSQLGPMEIAGFCIHKSIPPIRSHHAGFPIDFPVHRLSIPSPLRLVNHPTTSCCRCQNTSPVKGDLLPAPPKSCGVFKALTPPPLKTKTKKLPPGPKRPTPTWNKKEKVPGILGSKPCR